MTTPQAPTIADIFTRLQNSDDAGTRWDQCVEIARELGADALNVAKFNDSSPIPVWIRVSTHEQGGLAEYVANDYMSVDPVLVPRANNTMKEIDHISLKRNIEAGGLSDKERECYDHLMAYGQSDYITFRLRDQDDAGETLVVFSCSETVAEVFETRLIDYLSIVANLFALYALPPTPQQPLGKVPLLYEFLSNREKDVLNCLAQGMQNEQIAHTLGISEVTVRMHTAGAKKKMNASTRAQAIALALSRGLINV